MKRLRMHKLFGYRIMCLRRELKAESGISEGIFTRISKFFFYSKPSKKVSHTCINLLPTRKEKQRIFVRYLGPSRSSLATNREIDDHY